MTIELSQLTLDRFFGEVVKRYGSRPALALVGQEPMTYNQFNQQVVAVRENLSRLGLEKGDRIVLLGGGSPNWAIAFMAIITMGAIAVPIMDEFPDVDADHIIDHAEAAAIFIGHAFYENYSLPSLAQVKLVVDLDDFSILEGQPAKSDVWPSLNQPPDQTGAADEETTEPVEIGEDDLAEILYTSGTTGHSKGVMLSHKNLMSNILAAEEVFEIIDENSVVLSILPMAHAFGSTGTFLTPISRGALIYYMTKKPSPKILLNAMQTVRPTLIAAVPLIFEKIYHRQVMPRLNSNPLLRWLSKIPGVKPLLYKFIGRRVMEAFGGRLEGVVIGAASLNLEIEKFMRAGGIPYMCAYGLSECAPLVTASSIENAKIGAVGYPASGVTLKIFEPDPETGVGEILVKGPNVMQGYYKNEAETARVFTSDGWFITGDRGYLDEDGFLYIKGRSKNVIVGPSGENIYPEVIEEKLKESQFVEEALVYMLEGQLVGRVYPDYGYIQTLEKNKDEETIAADIEKILEQVRREVNTRLSASSRLVRIIEQREPFVKTPTRKIKRAEYVPNYLQNL